MTKTKINIIEESIRQYSEEFRKPNMIRMNKNTLCKLNIKYSICGYALEYNEPTKIYGLLIEIDNTLKDDTALIYCDKNIYRRVDLK